MKLQVYVDGACLRAPGSLQFGWAFRVLADQGSVIGQAHGSDIPAGWETGHNVAAELQAAIQGLTWCVRQLREVTHITVYHDYEGIGAWATGRWRAKQPMTQAYLAFLRSIPCTIVIDWVHVKAHTGHPENELVDEAATRAARLAVPIPIAA